MSTKKKPTTNARPRRGATVRVPAVTPTELAKAATGIEGLDTVTGGGLPRGRPTLVCGSAGSGKTLLGLQFIINGALAGEPGVILSFEETAEDLITNVASLGVDLASLIRRKKIAIDHVRVDRSEILETGGYDLSGLFVRIAYAIDAVGAKRILIDTLEVLFSSFTSAGVMRSELERLFHWLKERGVTAVVTGERGEGALTRHGLEEYVSDCVIFLDHRVTEQVTTRRLRVVKYRGTSHGTNEYPFLIGEHGLSVLPITGLSLDYKVSSERVSSGIAPLDAMLGRKGYYRGSGILISGTAGTGKSSVAASYVDAACRRGERCVYFALEEPPSQVTRNMRSIGIDLQQWVDKGLLSIAATRPTVFGLEQHLVSMHATIERIRPRAVVVDPISSLVAGGSFHDVKSMLVRLFDFLKLKTITGLFTYLSPAGGLAKTDVGVSSLIDTWIELRDLENEGERNRALYILKSRGMPHSNQVREFLITRRGLDLIEPFIGPRGVVIGSARLTEEAQRKTGALDSRAALARRARVLARKEKLVEAQIEAMRSELQAERDEVASAVTEEQGAIAPAGDHGLRMRSSTVDARGAPPRNGGRP